MSSRILLVEDELGLVVTISDLLASEGYEVDSATDGESALTKALSQKYGLILLDVMLPSRRDSRRTASTNLGIQRPSLFTHIDVHIAWRRQKLERDPQTPRHIQTVRGKGYRFTP